MSGKCETVNILGIETGIPRAVLFGSIEKTWSHMVDTVTVNVSKHFKRERIDAMVPASWGESWRKYKATQRNLRNRKRRMRTLRRVQYAY